MDIKVKVDYLLQQFKKWSAFQNHIKGVAIVGSFARGDFHLKSDVDLVIISTDKEVTIQDILLEFKYEDVNRHQLEQWGPFLTSLRIFYDNELEVEYGVVTNVWVKEPLDKGTKEVVKDGFKILLDKENAFSGVNKYLST